MFRLGPTWMGGSKIWTTSNKFSGPALASLGWKLHLRRKVIESRPFTKIESIILLLLTFYILISLYLIVNSHSIMHVLNYVFKVWANKANEWMIEFRSNFSFEVISSLFDK